MLLMGDLRDYRCPECGYAFGAALGVGMMFPLVYMETVSKTKSGELGSEAQKFFAEHPDGAVNCESVLMKCVKCGKYDCREALTMYLPKEDYIHAKPEGMWQLRCRSKRADYVSSEKLEVCYTKYAEYPHKCEECGSDMRILAENEPLTCPNCGHELEESEAGCWD